MSVLDISSVWKLVWSVKEWEEASESSGRKPNLLFSINTSKKGVKQKFEKKSWVQTIEEMPHSIDSILKQENEQRNHEQPPVFQFVLSISLNSSINGKWREIHFQNENKSLMTRDMELADIISIKMHRFLSLIEVRRDWQEPTLLTLKQDTVCGWEEFTQCVSWSWGSYCVSAFISHIMNL